MNTSNSSKYEIPTVSDPEPDEPSDLERRVTGITICICVLICIPLFTHFAGPVWSFLKTMATIA